MAKIIGDFTEQPHLDRYTLFMQDYGGPVGFRMALAHPERIQAMIIQNASVLPLLSRAAFVFASGASCEAASLITKAMKWTFLVSLLPLAFVAAFGAA